MRADGWWVLAEVVVGAALAAWSVRPATWGRKLVGDDGSAAPMRLVAGADEMQKARKTAVETWAVSTEGESFMKRAGRVNAAAVGSVLVVTAGVSLATRIPGERLYGVEIAVVELLMLVASAVPVTAARMGFRERQKAVTANRVDEAITELSKPGGLELARVFTLNRRQLDQYQELTRKQQRSAFRLTQVTSVVAFAALIAGVAVTFSASSTTGKYLSGGLAALGSALSAFLASTFFNAHKAANQQLNRYYLEPQRTGRLLAVDRLTTVGPRLDARTTATILDAVMSWEMPYGRKSTTPDQKPEPGTPAPAGDATATPG